MKKYADRYSADKAHATGKQAAAGAAYHMVFLCRPCPVFEMKGANEMKKTAIVTDSNCGITKQEADSLEIFMIPMPVCINDAFYYEGVDLERESFLAHLANHDKIHTSQPSPADLIAMWENVLKSGYDELVYIPMSSGLSGSFHTACQMAEEFSGKVFVADVRRISVTQRHAVLDALNLASHGMDAAAIQQKLNKNAANSIIFVAVDDMDYLKQGGRITSAAATIASVLNIKPLLTIGENKVDAYEKVRGRKNCERKLLSVMQEKVSNFKKQGYDVRLGVAGSFLNEDDLSDWHARAKAAFPNDELLCDPLTCSISCHVGPNAFGMGVSVKVPL